MQSVQVLGMPTFVFAMLYAVVTCESEISVRIEYRIESADSRLQLQCSISVDGRKTEMCGFVKNIARSLVGY